MRGILVLIAGLLIVSLANVSWAQHGHDQHHMHDMQNAKNGSMHMEHSKAMTPLHGGDMIEHQGHKMEVVYLPDGIRVYLYGEDQKALSEQDLAGNVIVRYTGADKKSASMDLSYVPKEQMGMAGMNMTADDYLFAAVDLSEAHAGSFEAEFQFEQKSSEAAEPVTFVDSFAGLTDRPYMCPMHSDVWGETAESECSLCGMKTDMMRSAMMDKAKMQGEKTHEHGAGH